MDRAFGKSLTTEQDSTIEARAGCLTCRGPLSAKRANQSSYEGSYIGVVATSASDLRSNQGVELSVSYPCGHSMTEDAESIVHVITDSLLRRLLRSCGSSGLPPRMSPVTARRW